MVFFFSPLVCVRRSRVRPDTAWQHGAGEQITTHMSQGPPLSISCLFFLPPPLSLKERNETLVCTSVASFFPFLKAQTTVQINSYNVRERLILCRREKSQ